MTAPIDYSRRPEWWWCVSYGLDSAAEHRYVRAAHYEEAVRRALLAAPGFPDSVLVEPCYEALMPGVQSFAGYAE